MDLFISAVDHVKRQDESGPNKLLNLLANPFRSQVSSVPKLISASCKSNLQAAFPIFRLRKFGHIDRFYLASCPRILPPKTLQLRRVLTEIEDCGR
jgi:hypothetical protein